MKIDERLVNKFLIQIANGDVCALENLFYLTRHSLFYFAHQFLVDKNEADDVVSEVFSRVARFIDTFNPSQNGMSWLVEIVKNTSINHNVKLKRSRTSIPIEALAPIKDDRTDDHERRIAIRQAMEKLELWERDLLDMYFWKEMNLRDISSSTGRSLSKTFRLIQDIVAKLSFLYIE